MSQHDEDGPVPVWLLVLYGVLLLAVLVMPVAAAGFSRLAAIDSCVNQAELAGAIQVGRVIEHDGLDRYLSRIAQWRVVYATEFVPAYLDYLQALGVYVFETYSAEVSERDVARGTLSHCLAAWRSHFNDGAPPPTFYEWHRGVYHYRGGG